MFTAYDDDDEPNALNDDAIPVDALRESEYAQLLTQADLERGTIQISELAERAVGLDLDLDDTEAVVVVEQDEDEDEDEGDETYTPAPRGRERPIFRVAAVASIVIALVLLLDRWAQPPSPSKGPKPPEPQPDPQPQPPTPHAESQTWETVVNPLGYFLGGQLVTPGPASSFLEAIGAQAHDRLTIDIGDAPAGLVNSLIAAAQQLGLSVRIKE